MDVQGRLLEKQLFFQNVADEYCKIRNLRQVGIKVVGFGAYGSYLNRQIELGYNSDESYLGHELRHHYLAEKTKNLITAVSSEVVPWFAVIPMLLGYATKNTLIGDVSGAIFSTHFLVEAYCSAHMNKAHMLSDLAIAAFPIVFRFLTAGI